jgi:hypothetical protein
LGLRSAAAVDAIIKVALLNPVKDVTSNRGKRIRAKLVALSYRLLAEGSTPSHVEAVQHGICAEVVELIHAGSLVVDDAQARARTERRFTIFGLVYLVNFLLPLGFCVLNGYWIAVFAGIGTVVAAFLFFGVREGSAHGSGFITGTAYSAPYFLESGPGWAACFYGRFVFED